MSSRFSIDEAFIFATAVSHCGGGSSGDGGGDEMMKMMMIMIVVMVMVIMMMMCCRCYSRKSAVFSLPDLFLFQHFHLLFPRPLGVGKIRLVEKTGRGRCSRRWTGPCGRRGVSTHSSCRDKTSERAFHRRRPSRN